MAAPKKEIIIIIAAAIIAVPVFAYIQFGIYNAENFVDEGDEALRIAMENNNDPLKLDEALEHYHSALSVNEDSAKAYNGMGRVYELKDKKEDAIKNYKLAINADPDYVEPYVNLGKLYYKGNEYDYAEKYIEEAEKVGLGQEMSEEIGEMMVELYAVLGAREREKGDYSGALEYDNKPLTLGVAVPSSTYLHIGDDYSGMAQYDLAITYYLRGLNVDKKTDFMIYAGIADAYVKMGENEMAQENYLKSIDSEPNYAIAYLGLGTLYADITKEKCNDYGTRKCKDEYYKAIQNLDIADNLFKDDTVFDALVSKGLVLTKAQWDEYKRKSAERLGEARSLYNEI